MTHQEAANGVKAAFYAPPPPPPSVLNRWLQGVSTVTQGGREREREGERERERERAEELYRIIWGGGRKDEER